MRLSDALSRLAVLETRGAGFHYTNCGIYNQGLFTSLKSKDDPTRKCTCGTEEALLIVSNSNIGHIIHDLIEISREEVRNRKGKKNV